jgi:anti-anti-sigma regulatory factor
MVVATGDLDVEAAAALTTKLRTLQDGNSVLVDLWDVTDMDPAAIDALAAAKERAESSGWEFGIVLDPDGPCAKTIRAAGADHDLKLFSNRQEARHALQGEDQM